MPEALPPCLPGRATGLALEPLEALPETGGAWIGLLLLLARFRRPLLQAALLALAGETLALAVPWLTGACLDQALPQAARGQLRIMCLGLVLISLSRAALGWFQARLRLDLAARCKACAARGLFRHLMRLPFRYFEGRSLGELLQVFGGAAAAQDLLLEQGLGAALGAVTALAYLAAMFLMLPGPALLVCAGALALGCLTLAVGRLQVRAQAQAVRAAQEERSALAELLAGVATLKATGCQAWARERWSGRLARNLHHRLRHARIGLFSDMGDEALNQGLTLALLAWGGTRVLAGELHLGSLIAFTQLSAGFLGALLACAQTALGLLTLGPELAAADQALRTPRRPVPEPRPAAAGPCAVRAQGLWFRHAPELPWVLRSASLDVAPGAFHRVRGPSGCGKSTLLRLLAGLYQPDRGSLTVDGLPPAEAAERLAYLPQYPHLNGGSILENLQLLSGGAAFERIQQTARDTGMDAWMRELPLGYQTRIASGGANLSGGQRQLLAITAVLASDKPVLLLDEALSSLDWVARAQVLRCPGFRGRTVIYASHEEILPAVDPGVAVQPGGP